MPFSAPVGAAPDQITRKTITFTGASGLGLNATATTCFTVTGGLVKILSIAGRVTTSCTVSNALATLALGVTGNIAVFIAATVVLNITGLLSTTPIWLSVTPTAGGLALPGSAKDAIIAANIIATVGGTGDVTGGVLEIDVEWEPITPGATLVAS